MQLSDFKIASKLVVAFVCVTVLGAGLGSFALYNMHQIDAAGTVLYERELLGLSLFKEANVERLNAAVALRDALLATGMGDRRSALKRLKETRAKSTDLIEQAAKLITSPEGKQQLNKLRELSAKDKEMADALGSMVGKVEMAEPSDLMLFLKNEVEPHSNQLGNSMFGLSQLKEQEAKLLADTNTAKYRFSRNTTALLLLLNVGVGVALGLLVSRHVTHPLQLAVDWARRMGDGDMTVVLKAKGKDETSQLLRGLDTMRQRLGERTEQLRQKTSAINAMLQNMPQGVLTVVKGGDIHPEHSAYMAAIFETNEIANRPLKELVFSSSNLGADTLSQVDVVINSVIGEDEMQYEFNSHLLPIEFDKAMADGRVKSLALSWSPIYDDGGTIDKLMLCVRDVTELKVLAAAAGQQKRELDIIGQILAISQEKFSGFIDGTIEFLAENKKILEEVGATPKDGLNPEMVTQLFRNMHTIKGNSRTYGLHYLTNLVHEAEQSYDELRQHPDAVWNQEKLLKELASVSVSIEEYAHINKVKLGRTGPGRRAGVEKYLMVQKQDIQDALEVLDESVRGNDLASMRAAHQRVHHMLEMLGTVRVHDALEGIVESLPSLAKELSKEPPKISIDDHNVVLRTQIADLMKNVFMHLYRNSMDHGIEAPENRVAKGKPAAGHINLDVSLAGGQLVFTLGDDGAGLALAFIRKSAIEKGLIGADQQASPEEIAQLIFAPGFSTAAVVTEVSGRGVGMDAVKSFVEREGGTIRLVLRNTDAGSDFRAFDTVISMPGKFAVQAMA
ncbi:MAG: MCP four helix bundle domain-containing protein [Pseudomonadota bacterium]